MKKNKKLWLILIPVVLIIAMIGVYFVAKPKPLKGSKAIMITVDYNNDEPTSVYTFSTDAEYLRQAMDEAAALGLIYSGDESEYGIMITEINGVTADWNVDQSYWAIYVNDEYGQYGADSQPVADGDSYKFEYTKGN